MRAPTHLPTIAFALAIAGCARPGPTVSPLASPEKPQAAPTAAVTRAATHHDLGPADAEMPADPDPKGREYAFVDEGPDRLFGTRGDLRRRPNAPGRGGRLMVAIDTPYQLYGRASTYVHVAAWRTDGRPAASARVFVGRRAVGKTDATGTLVFRYRNLETKDDDDFGRSPIFVIDDGRCGAADFSPYQRTPTFASDQLYVYTDRGVYRPGETVHVRVIGWRLESDYVPIAGGDVELVLRDGLGHSIAAATIHTDELGTGTAELRVPATADTGDYDLAIAYGGARESTDLQIRRFEAPQIRIDHTLPRHITRARNELAFTVDARPTTGGELGKARIDVEVSNHAGATVKLGRDVKGKGPHAFALDAKQLAKLRDKLGSGGSVRAAITVRDARGREDSVLRYVAISDNPYVAVLEPDKDAYATGDEVVVVARVSDIDDVAVRERDVVLVLGDKSRVTAKTDATGIATFRLAMPGKAQDLELYLADVDAAVATSHIAWTEPMAMTTVLADPVVREQTKVKVAARFPRGHVPVDRRVHVDITDTSGAIVGATILRAAKEDGAWIARGESLAPTWGSALFTFFALGRGELDAREAAEPREKGEPVEKGKLGLLVAGQQIAVVPDRELQIELHGVPDRAAPGEALEISAVVRDRRGRAVDFAASAAIVDSAVLALNDPLEVTPMDRFYDPDLRTLGTTGAQMLTWPVVTRNWGRSRWDVALPPFAFLGPGEADSCREHWDEEDIRAIEPTVGGMGVGYGGGGTGEGTIGLGSVGLIGKGGGGGMPSITVRKRFGDTSLWEGNLRGSGEARVKATLPDTIGEQEIVVVASDRRGGVGVARKRVLVDQDLFVEADLPDVVVAGESIDIPIVVHNRGKAKVAVDVALQSRHEAMTIAKNDVGATRLPLGSLPAGKHPVVVQATANATRIDRVEREIVVVPAGVPIRSVRSAVATQAKPATLTIEGGEGRSAHLRIDVPAVTAAFVGLDELLGTIADDPWALAGDLSAASIVLRLADRHGMKGKRLDDLRGQVVAAVAMTARVQRPSGAFAYWRNGEPSPYVTALVLDGLLDARESGIRVPSKVVSRAAAFLAERMPAGELKELHDIGWWEGDDAATRRAIESEIFAVLARLESEERTGAVGKTIDAMVTRAETTIAETTDVRALASATLGLLRLVKIDGARTVAVAKRLVAARDHGHWEPTWFSAWGGTIEATAAALEVLALASDTDFAIEKRDGLRWLLSTRAGWGTWHNERGTVAALRAIAAVGAPRIDGATEIIVRVDGEVLTRARVEADDPLAGALALSHVDLPPFSSSGKHTIVVEAKGPLAPSVTLVESHARTGKAAREAKAGIVLEAAGAATLVTGDPSALTIRAKGRRLGGATIRIARSGLVDLDLAALGDEVGRGGAIAAISAGADAVELRLAPTTTELDLRVPVLARRRGTGHWPAVAVTPVGKGSSPPSPLVVDPGALRIE
jgi:hypothetical protein